MKIYRLQYDFYTAYTMQKPWVYLRQPDVLSDITVLANNMASNTKGPVTLEECLEDIIGNMIMTAQGIDIESATTEDVVRMFAQSDTWQDDKAINGAVVDRMLELLIESWEATP